MDDTGNNAKPPTEPVQPQTEPLAEQPSPGFPVVGIGASAGGVAAFEAFFSTMPSDGDPGMAFVLVQHLSRDHKSILSELIRRYTKMRVFEVEDGMKVEPNTAYIIPPNRDMAFPTEPCSYSSPLSPAASGSPLIFSSVPWPRTSTSAPSALCSPARAATVPWASVR